MPIFIALPKMSFLKQPKPILPLNKANKRLRFIKGTSKPLKSWLGALRRNMSKTLPAAVALLAVAVAHHVDGPHSEPLARAVHYFWYTLWWFGLGVFSSIGLGTGPCPPLRRARPAARAASHAAGRPTHPASAGCARRMTRGARAAGAHTGSLFLFPHICAVVRTAERRRALDFDHTQVCSLPRPRD